MADQFSKKFRIFSWTLTNLIWAGSLICVCLMGYGAVVNVKAFGLPFVAAFALNGIRFIVWASLVTNLLYFVLMTIDEVQGDVEGALAIQKAHTPRVPLILDYSIDFCSVIVLIGFGHVFYAVLYLLASALGWAIRNSKIRPKPGEMDADGVIEAEYIDIEK